MSVMCFVCGCMLEDGITDWVETADGWMCSNCYGEIEDLEDAPYDGYVDMASDNHEPDLKDPNTESYEQWKL